MFKLINAIKSYSWGSYNLINNVFPAIYTGDRIVAEIWMGAHPNCSSSFLRNNEPCSLLDFISSNKELLLGEHIASIYGELPFLFKILCADKALSIQVHPSKHSASEGFERENNLGVPPESPHRNYKDQNHKPELIYALTPFIAMNGFRDINEIVPLISEFRHFNPFLSPFLDNPNESTLKDLFSSLLNMDEVTKKQIVQYTKELSVSKKGLVWDVINKLFDDYGYDIGTIMPLLLNVVELQPGEAMFLNACTPHAYISGVGLEVMANSDNVLRAGLTEKHIDVKELIDNVDFKTIPFNSLLTNPIHKGISTLFPVPVEDFSFSIHEISNEETTIDVVGPSIFLCLNGGLVIKGNEQYIEINKGESIFIGANCKKLNVIGAGKLAQAYTELKRFEITNE